VEGHDLFFAGLALTILEAAAVIGAMLGGIISDRVGRRLTLVVSLVLSPVLLILFLTQPSWIRYILLLLIGITAFSVTPVMIAMVMENFSDSKALANGLYMAIYFLLRSGAIALTGVMADLWGLSTTFYICAIVCFFSVPSVYLIPQYNKRGGTP